jgi:hypothetical protein
MSYDLNSIKNKIAQLSNNGKFSNQKSSTREKAKKLTYFKPTVGQTTDVRFLPYNDGNDQPVQEIAYYDSRKLTPRRIVSPAQWGKADPISELYMEMSKERQPEPIYKFMKELKTKPSWYAWILVRGQEDKGVQIWELNRNQVMSIYSLLANPDYSDENLMDPEKGYDFSVTVTKVGEVEVNKKVFDKKKYDFAVRRKSSPLAKTKTEREELVEQAINIGEYFAQFCMNEDKLKDIVTGFLASLDGSVPTGNEESLAQDNSADDAEDKIASAFDDIE